MTNWPRRTLVDDISRERLKIELWDERRRFAARLERDRDARTSSEAVAAVTIQAVYRGANARTLLRSSATRPAHGVRAPRFEEDISQELLALARSAGLVPLRGVTLAPKAKKTKKQLVAERRQLVEEHVAANLVQAASRRRIATKRVDRIRSTKREELKEKSVSEIQRYYRGYLARIEVLQRRSNKAASAIQTRYRSRMATKQHSRRRSLFEGLAREQHAAIRIQSSSRAKSARSAFVSLLRKIEPESRRRPADSAEEPIRLVWQEDK